MKIGFFGTPELASHCLERLCEKYDIAFVMTAEDKPRGRNKKITVCEAKDTAMCRDIDILQPQNLRDPDLYDQLKSFDADIYVVVAYGKIIPGEIYNLPKYKTINLHPSLLPQYRGAAPMQWALINGETETGITVQMINDELDAGDIVIQEKLVLNEEINAGELQDIVIKRGADLIIDAIEGLVSGSIKPVEQNSAKATYCKKIDRDTAHINWKKSAREINNLVRGLNPKPVAWTTFREANIKVYKTVLFEEKLDLLPGYMIKYKKKHLVVGTGDGCLEILSLQPQAKKVMDGTSFINGYRITEGEYFEN